MTQHAAELTAPDHAVLAGGLPGPVRAASHVPRGETAVLVAVVPLLSVPVLLATMGALWAALVGLLLTLVVAWLCLVRRVVVGSGWLADRRLWRYRVSLCEQVRAVELRENGHGGLLRVRLHRGRTHRLRRAEFGDPAVRAALATLLVDGPAQLARACAPR